MCRWTLPLQNACDLWLWDADVKKCVAGWKEMKFNKLKTSSAAIRTTGDKPSGLSDGDIHWGFLQFEPSQSRSIIDQDDVNLHIVELCHQLASTKSVFGWPNILCLLLTLSFLCPTYFVFFFLLCPYIVYFFFLFFYTQHTFVYFCFFFLCPTYFVYFYFSFFDTPHPFFTFVPLKMSDLPESVFFCLSYFWLLYDILPKLLKTLTSK